MPLLLAFLTWGRCQKWRELCAEPELCAERDQYGGGSVSTKTRERLTRQMVGIRGRRAVTRASAGGTLINQVGIGEIAKAARL